MFAYNSTTSAVNSYEAMRMHTYALKSWKKKKKTAEAKLTENDLQRLF